MRLSILIFDGFTALDAVGGYEVLSRLPGMEVEFVADRCGVVATDTRSMGVLAFRTFAEVVETDILYVPGGPGGVALETDDRFLDTVRRLDATSTWTLGVCNGVALLAAAGLLRDRTAACNWFYQERLPQLGATFTPARYHRDGKYVTSAGVSASIDAGLYLAGLIAGEDFAKGVQLGIEYYPEPPFPEKRPTDAPSYIYEIVKQFDQTGGIELLQIPPVFQDLLQATMPVHAAS